MKILYLEDDRFLRGIVSEWVGDAGHDIEVCEDGFKAISALQQGDFELAILDRKVPLASGDEVLAWIRANFPAMPVMFVASPDDETEVEQLLELGADDYMAKPPRRAELLARIAALGRRSGIGKRVDTIFEPPYELNRGQRSVSLAGRSIKLTPRQFEIAWLLFTRRGTLLTRSQIFTHVWRRELAKESRTIDSHMSKLRNTLELNGRHGWKLMSVYQHGYRLEADSSRAA